MSKKQNGLQRFFAYYKRSAGEGLQFIFNILCAYSVMFVFLVLFYIIAIFVNTLFGTQVFPIGE